jgi:cation diffusion facilitator family transporter
MGKNCCGHGHSLSSNQEHGTDGQRAALRLALAVNAGVLLGEIWAGMAAGSEAVLADAVHLLSHVLVILLSLFALRKSERWKAKAALAKGLLVFGLGLSIMMEAFHALLNPAHLPEPRMMSAIAVVAFAGNLLTLWIMARRRNDDLNMRSTWVCSQTDLLTNVGLIVTSALVAVLQAGWPDGVLGLVLGLLVTRSAVSILKQALAILRRSLPQEVG